jgi:predicted acetyltransferase
MDIQLKALSQADGPEIFAMIREIGPGENGFRTNFPVDNFADFQQRLPRLVEHSQGIHLPENRVPQTIYWMFVNGYPVGYGKVRHRLTEKLMMHDGHIGYTVRPSERGKGYGRIFLALLINVARQMGISRLLITCKEGNLGSRRIIEYNQGQLENVTGGICRYWIQLDG